MKNLVLVSWVVASFLRLQAQTSISGTVKNAAGEGLTNASIRVLFTLKGTVSDVNGEFVLKNIPGDEIILETSFIGYRTNIDTIRPETESENVNIVLNEAAFLADALIVQATRASESMNFTHSDLKKEEIDEMNTGRDIPYILNQTPSVVSSSDAGAGIGYTAMRIRGIDQTSINATINGVALNDAEGHGVYWVDLPDLASSISDIQIQRGIGTSTNGPSSFGATVNLRTEEFNPDPYAEINTAGGSFDSRKGNIKFGSGIVNKYWTIEGKLSSIRSDGYLDRASSNLQAYYFSGGFNNGKTSVKLLSFGGKEVTYQAWNGIDKATLESDRRSNTAGAIYDSVGNITDYYNREIDDYRQDYLQLLLTHRLSEKLRLNVVLHYTYGAGYFEQYFQNTALGYVGIGDIAIGGDTISESDMVVQPWLRNHYYGLTYNLNYSQASYTFDIGGALNSYDGFHFGRVVWARYAGNSIPGAEFYRNKGKKDDANIYVKASRKLGERLTIYADLQYRFVNYTIKGRDDIFGDLDLRRSYHFFNPKAGINFRLNNHSAIYFTSGMAHREPNRTDLLNSDDFSASEELLLDQELGYQFRKGASLIGCDLYLMYYFDQLVPSGQLNNVGEAIRTNSGESYRSGVELWAALPLFPRLKWTPNATYSMNTNLEYQVPDEAGNFEVKNTAIAYSPNLIINNSIQYRPLKVLVFTFYNRYIGEQYLDNTESEVALLKAYMVHDLRLEYQNRFKSLKQLSVFLNVFNALDEEYETFGVMYGGVPYYFPQAGRNFMAGISLRL